MGISISFLVCCAFLPQVRMISGGIPFILVLTQFMSEGYGAAIFPTSGHALIIRTLTYLAYLFKVTVGVAIMTFAFVRGNIIIGEKFTFQLRYPHNGVHFRILISTLSTGL